MARRVYLFSTDACTFCEHAKAILSRRGVAFEEIDLGSDAQTQAELAELTGLTSFPQILVEGETLGGLDELRAADRDGTLAAWAAG
jgi:glutaredoxin 3